MEVRESIANLDSSAWPLLGRLAESEGACFLDLTQLRRVTPDGVVALLLMTRSRQGRYTILSLPEKRGPVYRHLVRIDLVHLLRLWGYTRFERVQAYDRSPPVGPDAPFSKTLISISDEHEGAVGLVCKYIDDAYPSKATTLKTVFTELLNNLRDHSSSDDAPFYCTQVHAMEGGLHIAFGDIGVGFKASLAGNPSLPAFPTQAHALRAAVVDAASGLSHLNPDRGGGLQRAFNAVADLGGHYRVRSYDGGAHLLSDGTPSFGLSPHNFPGTLTGISLP